MAFFKIASCFASLLCIASGYISQSFVESSISVKRKVTVPEGRRCPDCPVARVEGSVIGFLQSHLNRLFHRHGTALRSECVELRFSEHGTQLCNCLIVFEPLWLYHRCLGSFAQSLGCTEELNSPLGFLISDG